MIRELIKAGAGIGYQPLWAVQQELKDGTLIQLLPDYTIWTDQLNATYVDRAFLSAKVRSFIDFLNEKISGRITSSRLKHFSDGLLIKATIQSIIG